MNSKSCSKNQVSQQKDIRLVNCHPRSVFYPTHQPLHLVTLGDFIKTPHQIWTKMTTLEGDKILIEDKLFEKDISGKLTEIEQDSSLQF